MSLTPEQIPPEIVDVCRRLREGGYQAYLVGGAVRDHLRLPGQAAAKDFDIATSARPEEVVRLFGKRNTVPTGIEHGTITVLVPRPGSGPAGQDGHAGRAGHPHREHVEVTTFRGEGAYSDGRRPDQVAFIDDLTEDLRRRDFTINAIAYDPVEDALFDPFHGRDDLARRLIRAVGDPAARFGEDGLRTMRAVRFAAQLGFQLDPGTAAAIPGALPTFRKVSWERTRDELLKLLSAKVPSQGLLLMRDVDLLAEVLPELWSVLPAEERTGRVAELARVADGLPPDPVLRLGALLWPLSAQETGDDRSRGPVEQALTRLKLPNRDRDRLLQVLLAPPLPSYSAETCSGPRVRRFLAATPAGLRQDVGALLRAWHEVAGDLPAFEAGPGALLRRADEEVARAPALTAGELALSGKDVMGLLAIPPGPMVGEVLRALLERVLDDPALNTRERLEALLPEVHAACKQARRTGRS